MKYQKTQQPNLRKKKVNTWGKYQIRKTREERNQKVIVQFLSYQVIELGGRETLRKRLLKLAKK